MIIFEQKYSGESMCDIYRDVDEAIDERYTPILKTIPKDEFNFHKGTFKLTITWSDEDDSN